jgi:hypothetical protein
MIKIRDVRVEEEITKCLGLDPTCGPCCRHLESRISSTRVLYSTRVEYYNCTVFDYSTELFEGKKLYSSTVERLFSTVRTCIRLLAYTVATVLAYQYSSTSKYDTLLEYEYNSCFDVVYYSFTWTERSERHLGT